MVKKAAVIGAGLGGLSAAINLAASGWQVDVYEKNNYPGGKASSFSDSGFTFDQGPSLLTMTAVLHSLFTKAGAELSHYITLKKLDLICKYFYADGSVIKAYSDINKFGDEINKYTADNHDALRRYLQYSRNIYDLTADLFLFSSPSEIKTFASLRAVKTLLSIKKIDSFRTVHEANSSFFKDPKTIQLFDRYATYNGSDPFQAPATLNIIPHVEYAMGSFFPEKGMRSVTESLYQLCLQLKVNFFFNSNVQKVITAESKIAGLTVNNNTLSYKTVVANVDINYFNKFLLKTENHKHKNLQPSLSGVVFFWGVKGKYENLELHNILFSSNYKIEFHHLFGSKIIPADPTIYIYISSKQNHADAPQGCENWFVMINAPNTDSLRSLNISSLRQLIIEKIERVLNIQISDKIIYERVMTPADIELNTNSFNGSIYGASSNSKYAAFLRNKNRSKYWKGLYFCGGSSHPGGGIPLVLLSGSFAAGMAEKDYLND